MYTHNRGAKGVNQRLGCGQTTPHALWPSMGACAPVHGGADGIAHLCVGRARALRTRAHRACIPGRGRGCRAGISILGADQSIAFPLGTVARDIVGGDGCRRACPVPWAAIGTCAAGGAVALWGRAGGGYRRRGPGGHAAGCVRRWGGGGACLIGQTSGSGREKPALSGSDQSAGIDAGGDSL